MCPAHAHTPALRCLNRACGSSRAYHLSSIYPSSIYPSSIYLSIIHLTIHHLSIIYLSTSLSVSIIYFSTNNPSPSFLHPFLPLSISCPPVHPSVFLSVICHCLSVYPSVCSVPAAAEKDTNHWCDLEGKSQSLPSTSLWSPPGSLPFCPLTRIAM